METDGSVYIPIYADQNSYPPFGRAEPLSIGCSGLGAKGSLSGVKAWRELHVQLLPSSSAQHDTLGSNVVA
jgi:hypothetical protein